MIVLYICFITAAIVFLGMMIAASVADLAARRRTNRREVAAMRLETYRAERELHRLASEAFSSMLDVARITDVHRQQPQDSDADDDVN